MVTTKFILFLTISTIIIVLNVENADANETDPSKLFEFAFNSLSQTGVQTPKQFCSSKRTPNPSVEDLRRLSALDLGAPSSTGVDVHNLPEHLGMTSQTDLGVHSSTEVDVHNLSEHLGVTSQTDLGVQLSTEVDVHNLPVHLGMTSQTDPGVSPSRDFDLNLTIEEYNEMVDKKRKMKNT